jgi:acetyl-CoA C-acetyltransferase
MIPEYALAEAIGAVGKPLLRVHTAGSVGGSTAIVASQPHRVVRACTSGCSRWPGRCSRTQRRCGRCRFSPVLSSSWWPGAGGFFAPYIRAYIARSGAPDDIGILVALKDRQNALNNPYAHLHEPDITYDSVKRVADVVGPDPVLGDLPVLRRRLRHGAGRRGHRRRGGGAGGRPAWIHGMAIRSEPAMAAGRDQVNPAGRP